MEEKKAGKEINSLVLDNGLKNKITERKKEEVESTAETECKFRKQREKEVEAGEDESGGEGHKYKQKQRDRRENSPSSRQKKLNATPHLLSGQFHMKSQIRETSLYEAEV